MAGDDSENERQPLLNNHGQRTWQSAKGFWSQFANFALNDNVLELAMGFIIASAFNKIVNSFTSDLILPIISLLPFLNRQLGEKFAILRGGPSYNNGTTQGYKTLNQALDDGAVVLAYGKFIDTVINFFAVGLSIFGVAKLYSWAASDPSIIKETIKCRYCRKRISVKAKRCVNCTSWQDGREDRS